MKQTLSLTDSELIAGFLGGQPRSFDLLMMRWHRQIYEFVFRYLGHSDDSHDIVQATFIRVYHNVHTLKDRDQFSSWLYRIALNMCHDHRRKRQLTPFSDMDAAHDETAPSFADSVTDEESGHSALSENIARQYLHQALQNLSDDQRSAIILKEFHGLTFREIAAILNENENTVKARLYNGLDRLRKQFKQWNLTMEAFYDTM